MFVQEITPKAKPLIDPVTLAPDPVNHVDPLNVLIPVVGLKFCKDELDATLDEMFEVNAPLNC